MDKARGSPSTHWPTTAANDACTISLDASFLDHSQVHTRQLFVGQVETVISSAVACVWIIVLANTTDSEGKINFPCEFGRLAGPQNPKL